MATSRMVRAFERREAAAWASRYGWLTRTRVRVASSAAQTGAVTHLINKIEHGGAAGGHVDLHHGRVCNSLRAPFEHVLRWCFE